MAQDGGDAQCSRLAIQFKCLAGVVAYFFFRYWVAKSSAASGLDT